METFVDTHGKPISQIELAVGETKIVGLKKYDLFPLVEVGVIVKNSNIAFCDQCVHLGDVTKKKYIDHYDMDEVASGNVPIEVGGRYYFQICGQSAGHTELEAFYWISKSAKLGTPYAPPLQINVKPNAKLLVLPPAKGKSVGSFATMWYNHPKNQNNPNYPNTGQSGDYPCNDGNGPLHHMQCFVRVCEALHRSGVSFHGFYGTSCQMKAADHGHHFSNPYEFPGWGPAKGKAYTWEAKPIYAPEPMPGLAAYNFVKERQGIILFWNYFDVKGRSSMWGGHIDLWNKGRMGNTYSYLHPREGEAAFLRAKKIMFWPLAADPPVKL